MQHCRRCDDAARQHALLLWSQSGVWVRRTSCDALGSASDSARSAAAYLAVYSFTPLHWSASSALCCSTRSRGHCACGMAGHAAVLRSTASAPPPYHRRTANHLGIVHGDGGVFGVSQVRYGLWPHARSSARSSARSVEVCEVRVEIVRDRRRDCASCASSHGDRASSHGDCASSHGDRARSWPLESHASRGSDCIRVMRGRITAYLRREG